MTEENIRGIEFVKAEDLSFSSQASIKTTTGFVKVVRIRESPLKTRLIPIEGLPSDVLLKKLASSSLMGKKIIE